MSTATPRRLDVSAEPGERVWKLAHRCFEECRLHQPVDEVSIAEPPGQPWIAAARQVDAATGVRKFLGELTACLTAPDDQHLTGRQGCGVRVARAVDHASRCRKAG